MTVERAVAHARVIVVGDGVAGAAACVALAQAGLEPLWLVREGPDSRGANADPVGESLSPAAIPVLEEMGLGAILDSPRHRASQVTFSAWGSDALMERNAFLHLEGPGRVIDRRFFEAQLHEAADAVATRLIGEIDQMRPRDDGGWSLMLAGGDAVTADFLIDATGRAADLGRRLGVFERVDQLVAATAFLVQRDLDVEPTRATLIEAVAQGWWYATLLPDGRLALAFFSDPDLLPKNLSRDPDAWRDLLRRSIYVGRWVDDAGFAVETPPRLVSAGTARLQVPCIATSSGSGWAAIGDAAVAFDPLSSHGLTTALWTASRAGAAAAKWLAGDHEHLAAYARSVDAGFAGFLRQRDAIYGRERRFRDHPFWRRRLR
ncbi:MAG: glycine oxidase maturase GoxB [Salinarimonas sp.]|nr:glycine oxidase maturase GoxB [Salinarimonas sp.]